MHPPSWYEENEVELLTGRNVMALEVGERRAKLQGGEEVEFGTALLATGAMVNLLRVDGVQLEGIHYLRAFGNADAIREDLGDAEHVVLVGGGYIGVEVAASLTALGKRCTIVEVEPVVLGRVFGQPVGRWFQELLEARGVTIAGGETVAAFEGDERVGTVLCESGLEIACDAVVIGVGVRPDTMLAGRSGLELGDGVACDAGLETSAEGIFAAGDCCSWDSPLHGAPARFEHWDVALQQGRHAAAGMLGDKRPFEVVPYFYSDIADWASLQFVGGGRSWSELLWRGEPEEGRFSVWYVADERLVGVLSVGRPEDLLDGRRLIADGTPIGSQRERIADPDSDLAEIG